MIRSYGENNQNSFLSFENRKFYDNVVFPISTYDITKDRNDINIDLFINKPIYGRIDHDSDSVIPVINKNIVATPEKSPIREPPFIERPNFLKKFKNYNVYAMNFVVDAFEDMSDQYTKYILLNPHVAEENGIGFLEPKVGWLPHKEIYDVFIDDLYDYFRKFYLKNDGHKKIKNFKDFHDFFLNFLVLNREDFSILYSSFTMSRYVSPNISGLMVEFSIDDHSSDTIKSTNYLGTEYYRTIMNLARKFGFYIDRNAPWRLIANLESDSLAYYMNKYNIKDYVDLFSKNYTKTYLFDLYMLRDTLSVMYLKLKTEFPTYQRTIRNCLGEIIAEEPRGIIDPNLIFSEDSIVKTIPMYVILRGLSVRSNIDYQKIFSIQKKAKQIFKSRGHEASLSYVNSIFNGYRDIVAKKEDFTEKNFDDSMQPEDEIEKEKESFNKRSSFIYKMG